MFRKHLKPVRVKSDQKYRIEKKEEAKVEREKIAEKLRQKVLEATYIKLCSSLESEQENTLQVLREEENHKALFIEQLGLAETKNIPKLKPGRCDFIYLWIVKKIEHINRLVEDHGKESKKELSPMQLKINDVIQRISNEVNKQFNAVKATDDFCEKLKEKMLKRKKSKKKITCFLFSAEDIVQSEEEKLDISSRM